MKTAHGFTLIEIIITLAIVGVLLALGTPALSSFLTNARIKSAATEMRDGLSVARLEAIRRNAPVCFKTSATGATGWDVMVSANSANCDSASEVLRSRTAAAKEASLQITFTDTSTPAVVTTLNTSSLKAIKFTSDGRVDNVATAVGRFDIKTSGSNTCKADGGEFACMRIVVGLGGLLRMCNPAVTGQAESC